MSDQLSATCPACGTPRLGSFRFCVKCSCPLPAAVPPPEPRPPAPVSAPMGKPTRPADPPAKPVEPPSLTPTPGLPAVPSRPRFAWTIWSLRFGLPAAAVITLVLAMVLGREPSKKEIVVTVGPDSWVGVDPRRDFGADRDFVVLSDGPIRMRTASGRPVVIDDVPPNLGSVGGGLLELKSVGGVRKVTLQRQ